MRYGEAEVEFKMTTKRTLLTAATSLLLLTAGAGIALAQNQNCPRPNCPNPGQNCAKTECPRGANAGKGGQAMNRGARRGAGMANNTCPRAAANTTVQENKR